MVFIYFTKFYLLSYSKKKNLEWMFPWMTDMGFTFAKLIWEWIHIISVDWLNFDGGELTVFEEDD